MKKKESQGSREVRRRLTVQNEVGLHARPAKNLVTELNRFVSDVFIEKDGYRINAKSIIGVLTLAAVKGTKLIIIAVGEDAEDALDAAEELFARGFGEI